MPTPLASERAGVFEVSDYFSFLAIDADDEKALALEACPQRGNTLELLIAVGTGVVAICFRLTRREKSIWYKRRAAVLAETGMSICSRRSAIFCVVLRVHFDR
jgi:hypothetical protein